MSHKGKFGGRDHKTREVKKLEAETRQKERDLLTPEQQLEKLDKFLGDGVGAVKERRKLQKLIEKRRETGKPGKEVS